MLLLYLDPDGAQGFRSRARPQSSLYLFTGQLVYCQGPISPNLAITVISTGFCANDLYLLQ